MKLEEGNRIKVGLDDFTQQVMGNIDDIEIPRHRRQIESRGGCLESPPWSNGN